MAESFEPRNFPKPLPTAIAIIGDLTLTGYSLVSVEFLQQGSTTPIAWSHSDFRVNQGQPTQATLMSTPSAHFGANDETVSGTLTITLSGGSRDDLVHIPETVSVSN